MELREQLEVEEEDGDRQEEEVEEEGRSESKRVRHVDNHNSGTNAQCVQTQCMYATQLSMSTSSLVSCLVSCMLYASFQFLFVML